MISVYFTEHVYTSNGHVGQVFSLFVSSDYGICKVFLTFVLFTSYSNKLQAIVTTGLGRRNDITVHIMVIVVTILHSFCFQKQQTCLSLDCISF